MKRTFAVLLALIALACFAGCLFALQWLWSVKKPAIDKTAYAFGRLEEVLDAAHTTIGDVQKNLAAAQATYRMLGASTEDKQQPLGFVEGMAVRAGAKMLSPDINDVQRTIEKVTEASVVVDSILQSLHGLEGLERINTGQVRTMQNQIGQVASTSWRLGGLLDAANPATDDSDSAKAARIVASLEQAIAMAQEYEERTAALQQQVRHYQQTTLYWMNLVPTLATIALGWMMFSQLVVVVAMMRIARARRAVVSNAEAGPAPAAG